MDPAELKKDILELTSSLESLARPVKALWPMTTKVLFSISKDLTNAATKRMAVNYALYDGSAENALSVWAAGIISGVMSRDTAWITVMMGNKKYAKAPGVAEFLKTFEDVFYSMLDKSNFYEFAFEWAYTAGWACTGIGFMEPDYSKKTVNFHLLPTGSYLIGEDSRGQVDTLVRWVWMQGREILKRWPNLPEDKAQTFRNGRYSSFKIRHVVRPREKFTPGDAGNRSFPIESTYWIDDSMTLLEEGGYRWFPFFCWRVEREPGSPYGTGPGIKFIRDAQIAQAVAETMLLADQKVVDPMMEAPESMRDEGIPNHPGAIIFTAENNLGKVKPIPHGINRPVGADREDRLRQAVERHFQMQFFLMQSMADRERTRAESLMMQAEQVTTLAPKMQRLQSEGVDPMWPQLIQYAIEFGLLPPMPQSLAGVKFEDLDIGYQSTMATLQKRAHSLAGTGAFLEGAAALNGLLLNADPEVRDSVKAASIMDTLAEANGVTSFMTDEEYRKTSAEQRRQAAALSAQAQAQMGAMQAMGGPA